MSSGNGTWNDWQSSVEPDQGNANNRFAKGGRGRRRSPEKKGGSGDNPMLAAASFDVSQSAEASAAVLR
jgi:hypothetical protein